MGLRARLMLFFVAIVVVPLGVVLALVARQGEALREQQADFVLDSAVRQAEVGVEAVRQRAADLAADLAAGSAAMALAEDRERVARRELRDLVTLEPDRADVALLVDPDGEPAATWSRDPSFASGAVQPPAFEEIAGALVDRETIPGLLLETRAITDVEDGAVLGYAAAGVWLDQELLQRLGLAGRATLCVEGELLAGVAGSLCEAEVEMGSVTSLTLDGNSRLVTALPLPPVGGEVDRELMITAAEVPGAPDTRLLLGILAVALVAAAIIGWVLADSVVAPVRRAAGIARSIAGGDLDRKLEPRGARELGDLAGALNTMSSELSARLAELERSRDELRGFMARLGETLSSSLDLNRTLAVVAETAMDTLGADRAALYLLTPEEDALYVKVGRGIGEAPGRLRVGEGIIGWVAEQTRPVQLPGDAPQVPEPTEDEPRAPHQLVVPMMGRGRVLGVLTLLRDVPEPSFTQEDLDTIRSFAAQASVAVENVMLHREAQRLSVTDPVTGLWNFRYFQLQAERELEGAARFDRPLALLIVDIDHFKQVNDEYGHQIGDQVLVEVAHRIRDSTRAPDVVARYGGEEFVVLLPGTPVDGAVITAERIRSAVEHARRTERSLPVVTCSVGVAVFPEHGGTVAPLLRSADAAMYTAKQRGRNQVVVAGADVAALGRQGPRWEPAD